jgi:hypothetical protein
MDIFIEKKKEICWNIKSERNNGMISLKANQSGMNLPDVKMEMSESTQMGKTISFDMNFEEFKHYYEIMKGFYQIVISGDLNKNVLIENSETPQESPSKLQHEEVSDAIQYNYHKIDYNTAKTEAYRPQNIVAPMMQALPQQQQKLQGSQITQEVQSSKIPSSSSNGIQHQSKAQMATQIEKSSQKIAQTQQKTQFTQMNPLNPQKTNHPRANLQVKQAEKINTISTGNTIPNTLDNVVPIAPKSLQSGNLDACFDEDTHKEEDEIKRAMDLAQKLLNQKTVSSSKKTSVAKAATEKTNGQIEKKQQGSVKCAEPMIATAAKDAIPKEGLSTTTDLLMEETVYMDAVDEEISKWMEDFQKKKEKMKVKEMIARSKKLESKMKQKNELEKAFHSGKITLEEYISQIEKLLY